MISVVKDHLVFMTEIARTRMILYRKVSVVSDYLSNVTSDTRFCMHRAIYMYMYLEYGTTVEYTCTLL